jgi:hypothetical protein
LTKKREFDAFICHAGEDKIKVARPLAKWLQSHGLKIWYDEFSLGYGDSISGSIDYGLAKSDYGIVILSKRFFQKKWPRQELNALISKHVRKNKRIILPIWHNISEQEIAKHSNIMADSYAAKSSEGIPTIAEKFYKHIKGIRILYNFNSDTKIKKNVSALSQSIQERERLARETEDELFHLILAKIYLTAKGYRNAYIHFLPFSKSLCAGAKEEEALEKCIGHMVTQKLIASKALGTISITHEGIKRFERLLEIATRRTRVGKHASLIRHSMNTNDVSNVLEVQRLRAHILKKASNSSTQVVNIFGIGKPLGIEREKLERIYFYLQDEGLIDFYALGGDFVVTEKGKELMLKKVVKRIL